MPCKDPNHEHVWPENHQDASLEISRCELLCAYCKPTERTQYSSPHNLIKHVAEKHTGRGGGSEDTSCDGTKLTHHQVELMRVLAELGMEYEKVYDGSDVDDGEALPKQQGPQVKSKKTKTAKPNTRKPTARKPTARNVKTRAQQATASARDPLGTPALSNSSANHDTKPTRRVTFAMDVTAPKSILKKRKAEEMTSESDEMESGNGKSGGKADGEDGREETEHGDVKQEQELMARLVAHGMMSL